MPRYLTHPNSCCICNKRDRVSQEIATADWGYKTTTEPISYLRCERCSHIFLDRIPDTADIAALYPPEYGAYSRSAFGAVGMAARRFAARRKLASIRRLRLEISVATEFGPGANPLLTKASLPAHCDLSYVDVNPSDQLPVGARVVAATAESGVHNIPPDQSLIVANQLIEHLADPRRFLESCREKLAGGGVLFLETPSLDGLDASLFGRDGTWGGLHAPRHFQIFSKASIRALLVQTGYHIQFFEYILSPFLWSESVCHYLTKRGYSRGAIGFARLSNPVALTTFCAFDMVQLAVRRPTSNMRVIAVPSVT